MIKFIKCIQNIYSLKFVWTSKVIYIIVLLYCWNLPLFSSNLFAVNVLREKYKYYSNKSNRVTTPRCQTGLDVALARYEWVYFLLHMLYSLPLRPATSADRILLLLRSGVLHGTVGLPVQRWQGEKGADHFHWIGGSRTVRGTRWRTVPDIAVSWCVRAPRLKSVHILHDNI